MSIINIVFWRLTAERLLKKHTIAEQIRVSFRFIPSVFQMANRANTFSEKTVLKNARKWIKPSKLG